jgi:perosamine synthetase
MSTSPTTDRGTIERISARERELVAQVLDSDFRTSKGSAMTSRLEQEFGAACGTDFAIAFVNGTCTMHAALVAAGIGPGDEVIVPPLTMASTTFVVLQAGAVPVFADVDPDTFQLDVSSVRERCTERTKGVIPVALYGEAPDLDGLMELAGERGLFVLEDDAETMCSFYKGRPLGSIGHVGSFSFQSSKHLTAGEGGMITTSDEELALKIRRINSLGYAGVGTRKAKITKDDIQDPTYARHVSDGFNFRMPELCAAVALGQLERREELVGRRVAVAELFDEAGAAPWLVPQHTPADRTNSYWTWVARLDHADLSWNRFRDTFRRNGGDGVYGAWRLTYQEPMFAPDGQVTRALGDRLWQDLGAGLCPVAERIQPQLLQFKTNYWDWTDAERQAEALRATVAELA